MFLSKEEITTRKFGKLRIETPIDIACKHGDVSKTWWICDCGRKILLRTINVVLKLYTKSCGHCNDISKEEMAIRKFGKLRMKEPVDTSPGSNKRTLWLCDCGKSINDSINHVVTGHTKSCGHCNDISKEEMAIRKFGKLRMKEPDIVKPGSGKKTTWLCDCGKECFSDIRSVISGKSSSCGHCNDIHKEEMAIRKFGKLMMKDPTTIQPWSDKKVMWTCDCTQETIASIANVISGNTKSCGHCYETISNWFNLNKDKIESFEYPILPEYAKDIQLVILEPILNSHEPFKVLCKICGSVHQARWKDIKRCSCITCGCTTSSISRMNTTLSLYIESFGFNTELEHKIGGFKYDVYVSSKKLIIEMNGLMYHGVKNRHRDYKKYELAIDNGYDFMSIFEDEWNIKNKQNIIKGIILNRLGISNPISIRPSKCLIKSISFKESNDFYIRYHYIGKCQSSKINYGVYFNNELIACASFAKPTRQSKYDWELTRMASNNKYHVHGVWSKILKMFIDEYKPVSIVSFSDNRLFSGKIYEKLGFKFNGDVRPDYYWSDNHKRLHKSGLRKKNHEKSSGKTEAQLREAEGYVKVWDLGKKRWVLTIGGLT